MQGSAEDYNLIFILSDQHKRDVAGCYGHPVVRTPNFDRFAERGTTFTQAYCQSPLCGPSRGSLITGMHCHTAGAFTQYTPIRTDAATLGSVFRDAGYETAAFGKMHVIGETDDRDLGFTHRGLRYYTYDLRDYIQAVGEEKANRYRSPYQEFRRESYNPTNRPLDLEDADVFDKLVVDRAIEFLQGAGPDRFFLFVGLEKPHPSWYAPKEYHDLYSPADAVVPEDYNQPLENVPDSMIKRQKYLESHTYSEEEVRNCIAAYYANVSYLDSEFGRLLSAIERLKLNENTLIVYTTDHGEILFEHGWVQKHCFFESAVTVPLILANSSILAAGKNQDGIVSLLDLFPTLMDLFGLDRPSGLEGESLIPLIQGASDISERAAYSEYYWTCDPSRMIRTPGWKYIYTQGELPQLYDMKNDPGERQNLATVIGYEDKCKELEQRVMAGWEIPDLPLELTAKEFRYRMKEEYLRKKAAGEVE